MSGKPKMYCKIGSLLKKPDMGHRHSLIDKSRIRTPNIQIRKNSVSSLARLRRIKCR